MGRFLRTLDQADRLTVKGGGKVGIIHEFSLVTDATDIDELPLDALFEAGCDDSSSKSGCGVAYISFYREARTREDAIATAVRDVTTAFKMAGSPYRVIRVEDIEFFPIPASEVEATVARTGP